MTGRFYWKSAERGNATSFQAFLDQLRQRFPGQMLHLILDNSSVHKNRSVKRYLERHPEVRLHFLPPYSPEYNPVEKMWWWLKKAVHGVLALSNGKKELLGRIRKVIWHYNEGWLPNALELNLEVYTKLISILAA